MEALLVGFDKDRINSIFKDIPVLSCYQTIFADELPDPLSPKAKVLVLESSFCDMEKITRILSAYPSIHIYLQMGERRFIKVQNPDTGNTTDRDSLLKKADDVKKLSIELRHDVRSPIQTIQGCSEKAISYSALNDERNMVNSLTLLQRSASRIMRAIPRFDSFHKGLNELIALIEAGSEDK